MREKRNALTARDRFPFLENFGIGDDPVLHQSNIACRDTHSHTHTHLLGPVTRDPSKSSYSDIDAIVT